MNRKKTIDQIIRVNQAGEYGAKRIYEGQLSATQNTTTQATLRHMADQENQHLHDFNREMVNRRISPTILTPLWHVGAFTLGKVTALLGEKAAMACTVAVEEVIDDHYKNQLAQLEQLGGEESLRTLIEKCRQEELEHRDTALENGAEQAVGYKTLTTAVKIASKTAIWLSKRI